VIWLRQELKSQKSTKASFRIVVTHVPPFIEFWDPKTWANGERHWPAYIRDKMVPLFEEHQVDLVLSGHQHNYQRGGRNGVTYVITGGGGGPLDKQRVEDYGFYQKTIINHHYLHVEIKQQSIRIKMKLDGGKIGDEFEILKR